MDVQANIFWALFYLCLSNFNTFFEALQDITFILLKNLIKDWGWGWGEGWGRGCLNYQILIEEQVSTS